MFKRFVAMVGLLIGLVAPIRGACTLVGGTTYKCASTGNPTVDGLAVWNFLNDKTFPCGSTIVVDAGASYTTPTLYANYSYAYRLKPQSGCAAGVRTRIISSRLAELPTGQRVGMGDVSKTAKLVAKGGPPAGGGLVLDFWGAANNWAFEGITFATGPGGAATGTYGALVNRTFDVTAVSKMADFPRDVTFDRCLFYPYEEEQYGAMETATEQAAFFRGVGLGLVLDGTNITVTNSAFKGIGGFYPGSPIVRGVTSATSTSLVMVTAPGIAAAFGLSSGGRVLGVFGGATGTWTALNGAKALTYVSPDSVNVYLADAYYAVDPTGFSGLGRGPLTGTVSVRRGQQIDPTYAILLGAAIDPVVENNFIESWSMPIFTGGGNWLPTNYRGIVQAGSTATSIVLDKVDGLKVGDLLIVPASGRSVYCTGANWNCSYGGSRVGKVTVISGATVTVVAHGPQGIDVAPTVGGQARWGGSQVERLLLKRNTIFRSDNLPLNGKGYIELKVCKDCLIDGNIMTDTAAGNWFLTSRNQAGMDPWSTGSGTVFSNNLVGGPKGSPPRLTLLGEDNENTSTLSEGVWFINNLLPGVRFPKNAGTMSIMDYGNGIRGGGWLHNTALALPNSTPHVVHYAGDYCRATPSRYGFGDSIQLGDNVVSYGEGFNTVSYLCLPGFDVAGNLFWADGSKTAAEVVKSWPRNHGAAANPLPGCDWEHWESCRLPVDSPYRGTATNGGDPGVDIDQLKAHLYGGGTVPEPPPPPPVVVDSEVGILKAAIVELQGRVNSLSATLARVAATLKVLVGDLVGQ